MAAKKLVIAQMSSPIQSFIRRPVSNIKPLPVPFTGRLVARMPRNARGLVIGFGMSAEYDALVKVLPNWGIVLFPDAPNPFHTEQLQTARLKAAANAGTHLFFIGVDDGVQTVFRVLASNLTRTTVGVAVSGGSYPENTLDTWRRFGTLAREGKGPRLLADTTDALLEAALGHVPALAEPVAPPNEETPAKRFMRIVGAGYGPNSPAMPEPAAMTELE